MEQRFDLQRDTAQQKLTALVFLSPWCESYLASTRPEVSANCRSAVSQFSALAGDPRVRWLGIASGLWADTEDSAAVSRAGQSGHTAHLGLLGQVFRTFRVNDVPTVLIADAGGRIVRRIEGNAVADPSALRAALASP